VIGDGLLRRWEGNWSSYQRAKTAGRDATLVPYDVATARAGDAARRAGGAASDALSSEARGAAARGTNKERVHTRTSVPNSERERASLDRDRTRVATKRTASRVRRVEGLRALESRIAAMELQLRQLTAKVEQIAQSGNYLETRRIGEEHAALERSLRELYDEWAKASETTEDREP
jgi:hypothetical protein